MNTPVQHDLSADETKLSFDLLVQTARIAAGYTKVECERDLGEIQNCTVISGSKGCQAFAIAAEHLAEHAQALSIAANTLHVLTESKSRSVLTIIGKPAVTK